MKKPLYPCFRAFVTQLFFRAKARFKSIAYITSDLSQGLSEHRDFQGLQP